VNRAILCALLICSCASHPESNPVFAPTESILEVIAVLRLHMDDDTYRFPAARDFTGKNLYRATFNRLENLEQIHAEKFKSGYMVDVILFAKGRCLERLGEYALAIQHYRRVAALDSPLREEATRSQDICTRLAAASQIHPPTEASAEKAMATFDRRANLLRNLLEDAGDGHYAPIVREEIERVDQERAEYFLARSTIEPWLDVIALQQYQHLVQQNSKSKKRNRHMLDLADAYASLARQYTDRVPPVSLGFDPATFDEYAFGATRLYEAVSRQDGAVEKIEASRKLEAFLAYTLGVYEEKLPH